jgi:hypothetical protein
VGMAVVIYSLNIVTLAGMDSSRRFGEEPSGRVHGG